MKEILIGVFIGLVFCSIGVNFVQLFNKIFKRKQHTMEKEKDVKSIEDLTIAATDDKQLVDSTLSDCETLISTIKACEAEEKCVKRVDILDESTHLYKLTILFDIDSVAQTVDFKSYKNKYIYDPSQVNRYDYKELLMKQTFALKFFKYMFPEFDKSYINDLNDKNGICEIYFTTDEHANKYILEIKYFYASKNISLNYPILNGYYFGCRIGSQLATSELVSTLNRIDEFISNFDYIKSTDKQCIKSIIRSELESISCNKYPQFKA